MHPTTLNLHNLYYVITTKGAYTSLTSWGIGHLIIMYSSSNVSRYIKKVQYDVRWFIQNLSLGMKINSRLLTYRSIAIIFYVSSFNSSSCPILSTGRCQTWLSISAMRDTTYLIRYQAKPSPINPTSNQNIATTC